MRSSDNNKLVIILSSIMFIVIAAVTVAVLLTFDLNEIPRSDTVSTVQTSSEQVSSAPAADGELTIKADESYMSKAMFIGDFVPVAMSDYGLLNKKQVAADVNTNVTNIADRNITVKGKSTTTLKAIEAQNPQHIYISLGSNDADWRSRDSVIDEYSAYVKDVAKSAPGAKIYLMSVTPVTAECDDSGKPYTNKRVDDFNSWVKEVALTTGCFYLDVNTALKGDGGVLPDELAESDGYHLKASAYQIVKEYILNHTAG